MCLTPALLCHKDTAQGTQSPLLYSWRQQHIVNLGPHLRPRVGQLGLVRPSSGQLGAAGLGHLQPGQILEKLPVGRKQDRFWSGEEAGTNQGLSVAIKPRLQNTLGVGLKLKQF